MAKDDTAGYHPNNKLSMVQRIADFLDWGAKNRPLTFFAYPSVTKAVMGFDRHPRSTSTEVEMVKRAMTRVRPHMLTHYKRGVVSVPSVGVRATTTDLDFTQNCVAKTSNKLNTIGKRLQQQVEIVDLGSFPTSEEGKKWGRFIRDTRSVVREIMDPEFERKLLPPKAEEANG